MDGLTLDQAARESGRSARELRLTIESGDLPAVQRSGRWVVDPVALEQLVASASTGAPAPEAAPRRLTEVPAPATAGGAAEQHPVDELLARLETRAVEVATLRERLGARRDTDGEQVERLERELSSTRMQLEQARRRIEELVGGADPPNPRRAGMRDALTPLFENTRAPGEPGS